MQATATLLGLVSVLAAARTAADPNEFVAGTFILTQESLDEAPYRYAGVLRKALDRLETLDPPSRSDESRCSVRYKIVPSGEATFPANDVIEIASVSSKVTLE